MTPRSSKKASPGFYVAVGCPGCGGNLSVDSNFFVTTCSHCGSPLRLQLPDVPPAYLIPNKLSKSRARFKVDRFLKSRGLPLTGSPLHFKYLYYPYWKVDALLLRCRNKRQEIVTRVNEESGTETVAYKRIRKIFLSPYSTTVAGGDYFDGLPDSIGVRGQSLQLKPFAASQVEEGFDALDVKRSPEEVVKTIELSLSRMNTIQLADFGKNVTKIFNAQSSLLFFPFCIIEDYSGDGFRRYVLDGLTGRVISNLDSNEPEKAHSRLARASSLRGSLFTRSITESADSERPMGAGDMPVEGLTATETDESGNKSSPEVQFGQLEVVFHRCRNCGVDLPSKRSCIYICSNCQELTCLDKRVTTKPELLTCEPSDLDAEMFPFWRFKAGGSAVDKFMQSLGSISESGGLTIPAFEISNIEAMYRLCKKATAGISKFELAPIEVLGSRYRPVDITPSAAVALAHAVYYRHWLDKFKQVPNDELQLSLNQITLCYLPFKPRSYFFVDSVLEGISFEKSVID